MYSFWCSFWNSGLQLCTPEFHTISQSPRHHTSKGMSSTQTNGTLLSLKRHIVVLYLEIKLFKPPANKQEYGLGISGREAGLSEVNITEGQFSVYEVTKLENLINRHICNNLLLTLNFQMWNLALCWRYQNCLQGYWDALSYVKAPIWAFSLWNCRMSWGISLFFCLFSHSRQLFLVFQQLSPVLRWYSSISVSATHQLPDSFCIT